MASLVLIGVLAAVQSVAVIRPRSRFTIENVYGGDPSVTDPKAYFAFNQGHGWADQGLEPVARDRPHPFDP